MSYAMFVNLSSVDHSELTASLVNKPLLHGARDALVDDLHLPRERRIGSYVSAIRSRKNLYMKVWLYSVERKVFHVGNSGVHGKTVDNFSGVHFCFNPTGSKVLNDFAPYGSCFIEFCKLFAAASRLCKKGRSPDVSLARSRKAANIEEL